MRPLLTLLFALTLFCGATAQSAKPPSLTEAKRILFLGDSITYAGHYVDGVDAYQYAVQPERRGIVLGLGLPSETVSGLSEEGHADGKFPRPDLHERLDRVLKEVKPDLVFACYGMNDGIYLPLNEERLQAYQRGIEKLREKVIAAGAQIVHLTPPVFDPKPIEASLSDGTEGSKGPYRGYGEVLERFAEWLKRPGTEWHVIDLNSRMKEALAEKRQADPDFTFAKDGVHPSPETHWIFTRAIVTELEGEQAAATLDRLQSDTPAAKKLLDLVRERGRLLTHAFLTATRHERPGIQKGLPLAEAESKAAELDQQIREHVRSHPELRPAAAASANP